MEFTAEVYSVVNIEQRQDAKAESRILPHATSHSQPSCIITGITKRRNGENVDILKMPLDKFIDSMLTPLQTELEEKQPVLGVTVTNPKPIGYVTPTITVEQSKTADSAPLLLISAAGAMGKSMASKAIANQLSCPRLDLSQTIVGQNSHSGILANALKISSFAKYTEQLDAGKASLVIDALDEAPLRSGDRAFFAFMESLAVEANSMSVFGHQIIILGRPQNIDLFSDLCEDLKVPTTVARIDSLALPSALDLIDQLLSVPFVENAPHRVHPIPAREFWKTYLVGLGDQLSGDRNFSAEDWDSVSDFLGYPPVLAALAPILDQKNYISALREYQNEHQGSAQRSGILIRIVNNLLDRESKKVQSALQQELDQLDDRTITTLYTHDEQISRILGQLGISTAIPLPARLPEELRQAYEDRISAFVSDHPFLDGGSTSKARNIVFSDYLRALVDSKVSYVNVISEEPLKGPGLWNVGPFYAYFMHAIAAQADNDSLAYLQNEDYVDEIIRSWVASAAPNARPGADYQHETDETPGLSLHLEDQSGQPIDGLEFLISDPTGVLTMNSPIYDVSIMSDHGLHLAASAGSITLGPRASVVVRDIETDRVEEVIFRGQAPSSSTDRLAAIIVAQSLRVPGDYRIVQNPPGSQALVFASGLDNRWKAMRPNMGGIGDLNPERALQFVIYIRRILLSFRGSVKGSPAIHPDKFSRHVVGRSPQIRLIADSLRLAGFIREGNGMAILDQDRLTELGVSYDLHKSPDWQKMLYPVLLECMKHNPALNSAMSHRKTGDER